MSPTLSWRPKAVPTAVPTAVLQVCALNLVVPPAVADPSEPSKESKMAGNASDLACSRSQCDSVSTASSDNGGSDHESPPRSPVLTTSWSKALQLRREASKNGCSNDADVMRRVTSILNKLTVEKFESLFAQLLSCGISSVPHLEMLVQEISEKASTQPHFASMYSDLSERLGEVLDEDAEGRDLGDVLLLHSQRWFDLLLQLPAENAREEEKETDETQTKQKARLLGNIRFTGELIMRGIISSKTILLWCKDLLQEPLVPTSLEALAIFLGIVGPKFDTPANPMHRQFREVFWQIRGITFDISVPARVRFLIRDILERKDAGWANVRAAVRAEAPKRLKDVHQDVLKPAPVQQRPATVHASPPVNCPEALPDFTPMMVMMPMFLSSLPAAQQPLRVTQPPSTKKRGLKLQNKSLPRPSSDAP